MIYCVKVGQEGLVGIFFLFHPIAANWTYDFLFL